MNKVYFKNGPSISQTLSKIVEEIRSGPLSLEDRTIARQHLLDAIASAFIGRRGRLFEDLCNLCPKVKEGYGLPGCGRIEVGLLDAVMIWSFAVNASVFEDGSREGACHPASAVIPSVIVLSGGRDWEEIDRAIIAGYEIMIRIARSGNPQFTLRGFHPTSITAPFGCVSASSLLFDFDLTKTQNALSLSAMGASGLMASFWGGNTQPLQVAWSVRNGLLSTMLAERGQSGYPYIFEEGFFPAFLGSLPTIPIDKPLDYGSGLRGSYLKPYPGCRHLHPTLDAIRELLKENELDSSEIERIEVKTYRVALETEIHRLQSREDAYFNIPYAVAASLVLGRSDWSTFDEKHFSNPKILELMRRVKLVPDEELERLYPGRRSAIVEILVKDGKRITKRVDYPLGEPENPLPYSFTIDKFRQASKAFLSEKSMERLETILNVSNPADSPEQLFKELYGEKE